MCTINQCKYILNPKKTITTQEVDYETLKWDLLKKTDTIVENLLKI